MPREEAEARRNLGREMLRWFAENLVAPTRAVMTVRKAGYGYRYQEMLRDYRAMLAERHALELGGKVRLDSYPPAEVMFPGSPYQKSPYMARIVVTGRDPLTGEVKRTTCWIGYERNMRVREILAEAQKRLFNIGESLGWEDVILNFGYVKYRP